VAGFVFVPTKRGFDRSQAVIVREGIAIILRVAMMARVNTKARLSPPLMHVFRAAHMAKDSKKSMEIRDEVGERVIASRRLRARQVITESVLRQEVARDLDALLNSISLESSVDMSEMPHVRRSILNFGIPDLTSRTIDENAVDDIPIEIRTAIINFEPRLAADSLQIERDKSVDVSELKVRFIVRAELTCDPVHVPVEFIADLVEGGKIIVNRL
jgi:type VI secretion system protein ImpF